MILYGVIIFFSLSLVFLFNKAEIIKNRHNKNIKKMEEVLDTLLEEQELLHKKVLLSNNFKKDFKEDFRIICDQIVELQKIFIKTIFTQKNT